ncbi:hypothetical protein PCC7424_5318 [Gloeothece citriformis PCC 7424]|uniref:Uncharacterized protein n=1 Tax=Gloeothece citriformis (strain PCC 7424) TaxID=65393 RepID=B7KJI8_GLOC7|nr:hypothetical protein [Gloeothece citriformis]ACK73665.1 hypothetical protein PCC7424_5318 [Gloeothece citriformis PCC 7424]
MRNYIQSIRTTLNAQVLISRLWTIIQRRSISLSNIKGLILLIIGYLLSPLSWWNDLLFNLPIAYGFGYLCSLIWPNILLSAVITGYWLSNVLGILLMQKGVIEVMQNQPTEGNLKKELLTGFISSTVYTLIILLLLQFKLIETPQISIF